MTGAQRAVYKAIVKKTPRDFNTVYGRLPHVGWEWNDHRVDLALQALRKAGRIKYLKKADGGPGWVRV